MPLRLLACVAVAVLALGACGAPERAHTLDNEPDLASISGPMPHGFDHATADELVRLHRACTALIIGFSGPAPSAVRDSSSGPMEFVDGQCEWLGGSPTSTAPEFIVGIIGGGSATFDDTDSVLTDEQTISGVGDRATFDPQTRTLAIVKNDRLWYVQLVGRVTNGAAALVETTNIGRALIRTPATR